MHSLIAPLFAFIDRAVRHSLPRRDLNRCTIQLKPPRPLSSIILLCHHAASLTSICHLYLGYLPVPSSTAPLPLFFWHPSCRHSHALTLVATACLSCDCSFHQSFSFAATPFSPSIFCNLCFRRSPYSVLCVFALLAPILPSQSSASPYHHTALASHTPIRLPSSLTCPDFVCRSRFIRLLKGNSIS